jgi:hypothetical protein
MTIIGITGKARSGKDTLARILLEMTPGAQQMSFASPIREFVARLIGVTVDDLQDGPFKEAPLPELSGKSPRQMMQTLGTEWGRDLIDPDLWIKVARWELGTLEAIGVPLVVFSDVRFDNEAAMIRSLGGAIVHLSRGAAGEISTHVSEAGISSFSELDLSVNNDGDLKQLKTRAREVLIAATRRLT